MWIFPKVSLTWPTPPPSSSICDKDLSKLALTEKGFREANLEVLCEILSSLGGLGGAGTHFDWKTLCDPATQDPVLIRIGYASDGTIVEIAGFNLDGSPHTGALTSLLTSCVGGTSGLTNVNVVGGTIRVEPGNNPIDVNIVGGTSGGGGGELTPFYEFDEQSVSSSSETILVSYTPSGTNANVEGVLVSGQAAGRYKLKVSGVTKAILRTSAAESTKSIFFLDGSITVASGDTVTVTGFHEEAAPQNLSASIFGNIDILSRVPLNEFDENVAVITTSETTILSYTPSGATANVEGILVSGQASGRFKLKVGGITKAIVRTTAAKRTEFVTFSDGFIAAASGQPIIVTAYHEESANQSMAANIFGYII